MVEEPARVRRRRQKTDGPNPTDVYVGGRVRLRRTLLGMSQEKLGEALGLTFQQVQKYERGANRVGASRLYDLSCVLDVPITFFFDDMPAPGAERSDRLAEPEAAYESDPLLKRETLELVRAYYKIADPQVRRRLFELAKALGKSTEPT
jgi:transcriptional regulator with XRE-family HTH domain